MISSIQWIMDGRIILRMKIEIWSRGIDDLNVKIRDFIIW